MKKRISAMLFVAALLLCLTFSVSAQDTAYLMYADAGWTYQYWGEAPENGVVATTTEVTGEGEYTVGLDFTETETGFAEGLAFTAIGIATGETTLPGYTIEMKSLKVNGSDVTFEKGYTSSDDGIITRMNIYNEWVTELPDDARCYDGNTSDANWIIVDKEAFASVENVEVTFELHPGATDIAYLMYADGSWANQYWGGETENGLIANNATITGDGSYTVGLDFTETEAGTGEGLSFSAVGITRGEETFPGSFIAISDIRVNGTSIDFNKGYTSSDDGIITRMNIFNEWVGELPVDARSIDGETGDASWIIVDKEIFNGVKTVEVDFDFTVGSGLLADSAAEEIDVDAALAADYNAYFGVQTESYTFRNKWDEPTYGKATDSWNHLIGWDSDSNAVDYGGIFTDVKIVGNGTYTVGVELGEMGLGSDKAFNMLFISTDIPNAIIEQNYVTISDVTTSMDGGMGREYTFVDTTEGDYAAITVMNSYNNEVGVETIPFTMPKESIEITFTISGLSKDAPLVEEAENANPDSTGFPVWVIILIAVVGLIAVVIVVLRKKKS